MKAIQVQQAGGEEQLILRECPIPPCQADEVLVQMKVAGINYIDIYIRSGLYPPPAYPYIPGKEGSGVVVEVGKEVKGIAKGDRVAFCVGGTGTYAEFAAIPADHVVPIPEPLSFEVAAAMMLQGFTAYYLSHQTVRLNHGDTILVHAGAGGVGLLLIQMAKMLGATILTTVSNSDKAELAKKAGADKTILYTQESFLSKVMEFTNHQGLNVAYDSVGKTTFEDSLKSLTTRGMLVSFGQSSGPVPSIALSQLAEKSLYLTRPVLANYTQRKAEVMQIASAVFDLVIKEKIHIIIAQRYALAEAAKAHADLASRKTVGKSILVI